MKEDLVADIGATNARFQRCAGGVLEGDAVVLPMAHYEEADALLHAALAALGIDACREALLAIAGPAAADGAIEVTNTGMQFTPADCDRILGGPCRLANDFYALARAVPHLQALEQLGGVAGGQGNRAVLGPGTGLGMAALVSHADRWLVVPSEGGHADLAPGNHLELELWGVLEASHGHVCWESVLSGSGLVNLYHAMSAVWGGRGEALTPEEISGRAMAMSDPVCHQTLETFYALLGAAAGNLALTVAAWGGIYIGGGIAPGMADFIKTSPLRRRFEERGDLSGVVADVPIYLITQTNAGLVGAMHCLYDS